MDVPDARAERKSRAIEEPLDVRPRDDSVYPSFEVRNPIRKTRYRVLWPEFPERGTALCTCTDFARRAVGTCKHLEAVWLWVDRNGWAPRSALPNASESTGRLWKRIDEAMGSVSVAPGSVEWRRPGRILVERR